MAASESVAAFEDLPSDFTSTRPAERSVVLDSEGNRIAVFFDENRIYVGLDDIAPVMQRAMIAIEDERFFEHGPFDLRATTRALVSNSSSSGGTQGGSTITQQYVKNVLVAQAETPAEIAAATESSYARKIRELRLAIVAEEMFTKEQILERYLNIAYYGGGAYGVEAAAHHYFSKPASKLTLKQAAMLAGMVQSPSAYDPERYPDRAVNRRNEVLTRMADLDMISQARAAKLRQSKLGLDVTTTTNGCATSSVPFFCDYVYRELLDWEALGETEDQREDTIRRGGLIVRTTLSPSDQAAAQRAVSEAVAPTDEAITAIAMVEPGTGKIKAMAHSRGYGSGPGKTFLNYAVDKDRGDSNGFPVGSTMKPFVLAAAIQQGIPLNTKITSPGEINLPVNSFSTCDEPGGMRSADYWNVRNYSGDPGVYDLRSGTWRSVNTFYAQLEQRTGICAPAKIASKTGLTKATGEPLDQYASFVLGAGEVSPLSIAEAYATFAARGVHCESIAIKSIKTASGDKYPAPSANCAPVLDQAVADATTEVLRTVIDGPDPSRTAARMSIGRPAGGKTGTTDDATAVWFSGFTPQLSASAVTTYPDTNNRSLTGVVLNGVYYGTACGGCIPGPIWQKAMAEAMSTRPVKEFTAPDPTAVAGVPTTVPDVRNMTGTQAVAELKAAGFEAYVAAEVNSAVAQGLTVYTNPAVGAYAESGSTVQVYVSTGYVPPPPPAPEPKKSPPKNKKRN